MGIRLACFAVVLLASCASPAAAPAPPDPHMFEAGDAYERFMGRWGTELAPRFVDFIGIHDGARVLDVGAGTGAVALVVEANMPSSEVVGIDPSAGLLDKAQKRTRSARVRFEVGDAQALRFDDKTFDVTVAQLVMNFIPDHEKALREMVRVTRPGGVVGACVWDYGAGMQMLRAFWDEVVALDPSAASKDERTMKLSKPGELGELWSRAALTAVEERPLSFDQHFASFDDYWAPFLAGAGPAGEYVKSLDKSRVDTLASRLRARLSKGTTGGAITLRATANCVKGVAAKR